jgi:hypothetical protein
MADIAIMQPYFIPFAGYFQLFAAADLVVLFDCVQFKRRGRIHRNLLRGPRDRTLWLTLPLTKQPRNTRIVDLRFRDGGADEFVTRCRFFDALNNPKPDAQAVAAACLRLDPDRPVIDYLQATLQAVLGTLSLSPRILRSSSLGIPEGVKGQDRILEICRRLAARRYINVSGGTTLYDPAAFERSGIDLRFLGRFTASRFSILQDLHDHGAATARRWVWDYQLLRHTDALAQGSPS